MRKLIFGLIINLLVCAYSQASMGSMWFERMTQAISTRDYQGTYIIRGDNKLFAYYLQHTNFENNSVESILQLDQDGIEIISDSQSITQLIPTSTQAGKHSIIKPSPFSIFSDLSTQQLLNNYIISILPKERICGYQAVVLQLTADKWRHGYKIWIEQQSALPLKVAVINELNETIEEYRFVDLEIKELGDYIELAEIESKLENNIVIKHQKTQQATEPVHSGEISPSPVTWRPANFSLVSSGKINSGHEHYLNYTYSDGLNTFSVLVSQLPEHQTSFKGSSRSMGATNILITNKDQKLISILGEVPIQTLQKIAESVEFITASQEVLP